DRHDLAVVEVGTSARGEIAALAAICEPDVGVLTLVAAAHTEGIGTIDDVACEKGDLFAALDAHGVAVGNADDDRVVAQLQRGRCGQKSTYGLAATADYRLLARAPVGLNGARLSVARRGDLTSGASFTTPLLGHAGALSTLAGLAVGDAIAGR